MTKAKDIYDQHAAAFNRVSAFVVLKDGERVATIAIKFPADGAGRLYAYVHWIGTEMVRGHANGFGYDKRSAAVCNAASRLDIDAVEKRVLEIGSSFCEGRPWREDYAHFIRAAKKDDGHDWTRNLEAAGFTVMQAV